MTIIRCNACHTEFVGDTNGESPSFDAHAADCPAITPPVKGATLITIREDETLDEFFDACYDDNGGDK